MQKGPWAGTNLVRLGQSYTIAEENKGLTWYPNIGIRWYPGYLDHERTQLALKMKSNTSVVHTEYVYVQNMCIKNTHVQKIYIYIEIYTIIYIN